MIEGVRFRELIRHQDERGSLSELLRSDWPEFTRFGQAIVTVNLPGVIRGWHRHRRQTDAIVVLSGTALVPVYDPREGSRTRGQLDEHVLDGSRLRVVFVPPGVYHGYRTIGTEPALIVNFPDALYDPASPDEERIPHDDPTIGYRWEPPR